MNGTTLGITLIVGALTLGLIYGELLPEQPIPVEGTGITDDAEPTIAVKDPDSIPDTPGAAKSAKGGKGRAAH
jgi:hypothetical protein